MGSKHKKQKTKYFWEKYRDTKPQEATLMWFLWANVNSKYQIPNIIQSSSQYL